MALPGLSSNTSWGETTVRCRLSTSGRPESPTVKADLFVVQTLTTELFVKMSGKQCLSLDVKSEPGTSQSPVPIRTLGRPPGKLCCGSGGTLARGAARCHSCSPAARVPARDQLPGTASGGAEGPEEPAHHKPARAWASAGVSEAQLSSPVAGEDASLPAV